MLYFLSICYLMFWGGQALAGETLLKFSGSTMGTSYHISISGFRPVPLEEKIQEIFEDINQQMSTYREASEISQFNRLHGGQSLVISRHFQQVLKIAKKVHRDSGGAFEPTMGPLVNLWGFGPEGRRDRVPSKDEVLKAQASVGFQHVRLEGGNLTAATAVYLDLSAVAKGYAVDGVADYLESVGLVNYLVEVGGEVRTQGVKSPGQDWTIGIELPDAAGIEVMRVLQPKNLGLATSGDYRNYFEKDGVRYSHIIDPRTASPIKHSLASVSVLADSCAVADAWATALMVLGDEEGYRLAQKNKLKALFVVRSPQGFTYRSTSNFDEYLVN